jgi:hypothetical protein
VDNGGATKDRNGIQTEGSAATFWDEAGFLSADGRKFVMKFVLGSAVYVNNYGTFNLPDEVFTASGDNGTLIGDSVMDGNIPGCGDHAGTIVVKLRPDYEQTEESPDIITTSIKKEADNSWRRDITVDPTKSNLLTVLLQNTNDPIQNRTLCVL